MNQRVTLTALAAAAATLVAAGCGQSSKPAPSSAALQSALKARGIETCNSGTVDTHFSGAGEGRWYALSHNCQTSNQAVVIGVIPFDNNGDRDAAFRQALFPMRMPDNRRIVMTFNDNLVMVTRISNRDLAQQIVGTLKSKGAS